jgi:hypothetical protein
MYASMAHCSKSMELCHSQGYEMKGDIRWFRVLGKGIKIRKLQRLFETSGSIPVTNEETEVKRGK